MLTSCIVPPSAPISSRLTGTPYNAEHAGEEDDALTREMDRAPTAALLEHPASHRRTAVADLPWIVSAPTPWPYSSPRRAPLPRRTAVDPAWARHPKHLRRPNGQLEEFHYIGALAEALGKSPFSVRRWERGSVLPPTPFLQRVWGGPARRLYLRDQIEGIVRIAEQEGVAHGKPANISATNFTPRVTELYTAMFSIG